MTVESLLKVIEEGMTVILKTEKNRIIHKESCSRVRKSKLLGVD